MPSRSHSYFHWSMDKPCTTNQIYGYDLRDSMVDVPHKKKGPNDYTRPFSNSAFFPQISEKSLTTTKANDTRNLKRPATTAISTRSSAQGQTKIINRGYEAGHTPVTEKLKHNTFPAGMQMDRSRSAGVQMYAYQQSKSERLYLWHTLSGSLVHAKHYPSPNQQAF